MTSDPLKTWRKPILILYRCSFFLPIGPNYVPGALIFVMAFGVGLFSLTPLFLLIWLANPLFWWGQVASKKGNRWLAATLGVAATLASFLSFIPAKKLYEEVTLIPPSQIGLALIWVSGHLTWMASLSSMAVVEVVAWWVDRPDRPFQITLKMCMITIAAIALAMGAWPWFLVFLCKNHILGSEFPMPPWFS